MTKEGFQAVIGRAVVDAGFRNTLLADPDQALAGFALTQKEEYILKRIDGETIDAMGHILDACVSRIRYVKEKAKPVEPCPSNQHPIEN